MPLAAVLDQESEQRADALQLDGINDAPLVAARAEETGALELGEVRGHGRGRDTEAQGDLARGQADRPLTHEQPEDAQPMLLGQSGQCLDRCFFLHVSDIAETSKDASTSPSSRRRFSALSVVGPSHFHRQQFSPQQAADGLVPSTVTLLSAIPDPWNAAMSVPLM